MGLLSALWTGAKVMFGASSASEGTSNVMKVASGVGQFIDEQELTEEEAAVLRGKAAEQYGKFMESTVSENSQRSITRREIAIWVIRVELACLMLYGALASFGLTAASVWKEISFDSPLSVLTWGVGGFFFGTHLIRAATKQ